MGFDDNNQANTADRDNARKPGADEVVLCQENWIKFASFVFDHIERGSIA